MEAQQDFQPYGAPVLDAGLLAVQPPARVVGRNRELAAAYSLTRSGAPVLLAGPSGAGKTTLAAVIASAYLAAEQGGVLWLNAPEDDLAHVVARVGRAYGADTYSAARGDLTRHCKAARALLAKNRPLVVLDGVADLGMARTFTDQCAVDIPLIVIAEQIGIGPWTALDLEPLTPDDAAACFRYYGGLRADQYEADIAALCRTLEGWPLTLELAARFCAIENVTPAELLTMLPASVGRDGLQALLSLIFNGLHPAVQGMVLVLAAAFLGTATPALAQELSGMSAENVQMLARQLIARGLARETRAYDEPAYMLHEAVQRYALARMRSTQKLHALEARTLQTVLGYVQRHARQTVDDHNRLAAELGNIMAAAAYATAHNDGASLLRLTTLLETDAGSFIADRGFAPEMAQLARLATLVQLPAPASVPEALAAAEAADVTRPYLPELAVDEAALTRVSGQTLPATGNDGEDTPVLPDTEAMAPLVPPESAAEGDTRPAVLAALEPVELAEGIDSETLAGLVAADEAAEAAAVYEPPVPLPAPEAPPAPEDTQTPTLYSLPTLYEQLAEAREAQDTQRIAPILHTIATYHAEHDDPGSAEDHFQQALAAYEALGNQDGMASALEGLAGLAAEAGRHDQAADFARRGIEVAAPTGDRARLGRLYLALGDALRASNTDAVEPYTEAVENLRELDDWPMVGIALEKLGAAYMARGQAREALMMFEQALVIFHRESRRENEMLTLLDVANVYARQQQWQPAQEFAERALFLARECFDRTAEARALEALASAARLQNDRETAVKHYRQALHAAYQADSPLLQASIAFELGGLLLDDTRTLSQAVALLRESRLLNPENTEALRLLQRADKRIERMLASGSTIAPPEGSPRDYAAGAYVV